MQRYSLLLVTSLLAATPWSDALAHDLSARSHVHVLETIADLVSLAALVAAGLFLLVFWTIRRDDRV